MFKGFAERQIKVGDIEIACVTGGSGPPLDIPQEWRKRFRNPKSATLPGGHFFVDQFPAEVSRTLGDFLGSV